MKTKSLFTLALAGLMVISLVTTVGAELPKMKMTTDIPDSIIMPDKIETRIGTLELFDGFPSDETVERAYDFLLFQRGVDVFLDEIAEIRQECPEVELEVFVHGALCRLPTTRSRLRGSPRPRWGTARAATGSGSGRRRTARR